MVQNLTLGVAHTVHKNRATLAVIKTKIDFQEKCFSNICESISFLKHCFPGSIYRGLESFSVFHSKSQILPCKYEIRRTHLKSLIFPLSRLFFPPWENVIHFLSPFDHFRERGVNLRNLSKWRALIGQLSRKASRIFQSKNKLFGDVLAFTEEKWTLAQFCQKEKNRKNSKKCRLEQEQKRQKSRQKRRRKPLKQRNQEKRNGFIPRRTIFRLCAPNG